MVSEKERGAFVLTWNGVLRDANGAFDSEATSAR